MLRLKLALLAALSVAIPALAQPAPYFPPPGAWEHRRPAELGVDNAAIQEAVDWAKEQDSGWDFAKQPEIFGRLIGPLP
ncbi:MAG: serine hydrolase, partial [Planctomycetes bacterium]|nr:serine hydrolase [Planctomycetota bacterium]